MTTNTAQPQRPTPEQVRVAVIGTQLTRSGDIKQLINEINNRGAERAFTTEEMVVDRDNRTVEFSFSSEYAEGSRWFGIEILDHSPGAIDFSRLNSAGPLLWMHDTYDQRGVVLEAWLDQAARKGRVRCRFSKSETAEQLLNDVADGIVRNVSCRYKIDEMLLEKSSDEGDVYRVTKWTPVEVSFVSVPFDPTVGIGRAAANRASDPTVAANRASDPTVAANPPLGATQATGESEQQLPSAARSIPQDASMKTKVIVHAGDLVRAEFDENGNFVKVIEVLERGYEAKQSAEQTQNERARAAEITKLGAEYGLHAEAARAVEAGTTVADFSKEALASIKERGFNPYEKTKPAVAARALAAKPQELGAGLSENERSQYSLFNAIRALMPAATAADKEAARFEFEVSEELARKYGKSPTGILVPEDIFAERAFNAGGAANTPTGAQSGQFLVHTEHGGFIEMLRNHATAMRLAKTLPGLVGDIDFNAQTGGATGYWIGEGANAPEGTPVIATKKMTPKTCAAYVDITRRLMKQTAGAAEALVRADLISSLGLTIDKAFYYGSGSSNEPLGLKSTSGINAFNWTTANTFTWAEIVKLETEVAADNADIGALAYVLNATARGALKTTPRVAGTEGMIWEPGNSVNGYRAEVTNQLLAGDVVFGNFADVLIGMWGGLDISVDTSALSLSGGTRVIAMQDIDVLVRHPASICWAKNP